MSFIFLGITKLVASQYVMKHQIEKGDNRGIITIARDCIASGVDGPRFYLLKA